MITIERIDKLIRKKKDFVRCCKEINYELEEKQTQEQLEILQLARNNLVEIQNAKDACEHERDTLSCYHASGFNTKYCPDECNIARALKTLSEGLEG